MLNEGIYTILDLDTVIYLLCYQHRDNEDVDLVLQDTDKYIRTLLDNTAATYYAGFIGGTKCFRYDIAKTKAYKSNRPPSPDWFIKWSGIIKAYLRDEWNFQVVNGIEADDAVCIYQTWCRDNNKNSIMCHGDKDLYQIEGNHYNIRTHKRDYIDKVTALRNLYRQILTGDASDAITGCRGVGKKGAEKLIDHLNTELDMVIACHDKFNSVYGDEKGPVLYTEMKALCKLLTYPTDIIVTFYEYTPKVSTEEPEIDLTGIIWD